MMSELDEALREQLLHAWRQNAGRQVPSFDQSWQAAAKRHAAGRRNYRRFAAVAAITAAIVITMNVQLPAEDPFIEVADLLETTYWVAPSDVLLPHREFDIYQDMPVIFESTKPAGGTLL
ncbi:MAG: hypothetical protein OEM25_05715 [Gammaproteobacteria bacterium]|nr:hypothetical protein [Gammaproteobacteria bacterium]